MRCSVCGREQTTMHESCMEIERLKAELAKEAHLHKLDHELADQWRDNNDNLFRELERVKAELKVANLRGRLIGICEGTQAYSDEAFKRLEEELAQLKAERDRLREALEKYADEDNWAQEMIEDSGAIVDCWIPDTDGHRLAQAALEVKE